MPLYLFMLRCSNRIMLLSILKRQLFWMTPLKLFKVSQITSLSCWNECLFVCLFFCLFCLDPLCLGYKYMWYLPNHFRRGIFIQNYIPHLHTPWMMHSIQLREQYSQMIFHDMIWTVKPPSIPFILTKSKERVKVAIINHTIPARFNQENYFNMVLCCLLVCVICHLHR